MEKELSQLDEEMKKYGPQIEAIEKSMQIREQQIEEIKLRMNSVEDVVFSNFCKEIGVQNIRQYEDRELRAQEERKKKRLEFEKQINRITSNLDFERSRDTQSKSLFIHIIIYNFEYYFLKCLFDKVLMKKLDQKFVK